MHKSKLAGFIIDCKTGDLEQAAKFWSAALGMELQKLPGEEGEKYVRLKDPGGLHIEVQKVAHDSRIHLDIETDDINSEVQRLLQCGATMIEKLPRWCVLQAPTGQRFCVVKSASDNFEDRAKQW